jgi:hypothetical protein
MAGQAKATSFFKTQQVDGSILIAVHYYHISEFAAHPVGHRLAFDQRLEHTLR